MARRKIIEDEMLIQLIDQYFQEKHYCNHSKVKFSKIAEYIREHGYPEFAVEILRRNELVRAHIETISETYDMAPGCVVAYKTLDAEEFLTTHTTRVSLKSALTELDSYYQDVSETALKIGEQYQVLLLELKELQSEKERIEERYHALVEEANELKQHNKKLVSILQNYLYPEIANDLLAREGVLPGMKTHLDPVKLTSMVIKSDTEIKKERPTRSESSIIQGIFDRLENME